MVDERDVTVAERHEVIDRRLGGRGEIDVDVRAALQLSRPPDHRVGHACLVEHLDPWVVETDLHEEDAVGHPLLGQVADPCRLVRRERPEHQVVAGLASRCGGTRDELRDRAADPRLGRREDQREHVAAARGEPTGHGVAAVAEVAHGRLDPSARLVGDLACPVERVRHRAERHVRSGGNVLHRHHLATSSWSAPSGERSVEALRRSASMNTSID
ncbi:hypothetical protein D3C74_354770 [compost metagenome]